MMENKPNYFLIGGLMGAVGGWAGAMLNIYVDPLAFGIPLGALGLGLFGPLVGAAFGLTTGFVGRSIAANVQGAKYALPITILNALFEGALFSWLIFRYV